MPMSITWIYVPSSMDFSLFFFSFKHFYYICQARAFVLVFTHLLAHSLGDKLYFLCCVFFYESLGSKEIRVFLFALLLIWLKQIFLF